jgi:hypothetical protein
MKASVLLTLLCISAGCATSTGLYPSSRDADLTLSLVGLLSAPRTYHRRTVAVVGYLHLEHDGNLLYLRKEDFDHRLHTNAVWIEIPDTPELRFDLTARFSGRYVMVKGTYDATRADVSDLPSGTLTQITHIMAWDAGPADTWPASSAKDARHPFVKK